MLLSFSRCLPLFLKSPNAGVNLYSIRILYINIRTVAETFFFWYWHRIKTDNEIFRSNQHLHTYFTDDHWMKGDIIVIKSSSGACSTMVQVSNTRQLFLLRLSAGFPHHGGSSCVVQVPGDGSIVWNFLGKMDTGCDNGSLNEHTARA